ncbi:CAP domain-containing protein, partial [Peptococcus simiae]
YKALEAPRKPFTADQLRMLELVNAARAEHGLQPVKLSPALCEGAEIRAREFGIDQKRIGATNYDNYVKAKNNGWDPHNRLDGKEYDTVLLEIGLASAGISMRENLAALPPVLSTPENAMKGWMESPGHRANILNPFNVYMGIAHSDSTAWDNWAQLFQ